MLSEPDVPTMHSASSVPMYVVVPRSAKTTKLKRPASTQMLATNGGTPSGIAGGGGEVGGGDGGSGDGDGRIGAGAPQVHLLPQPPQAGRF